MVYAALGVSILALGAWAVLVMDFAKLEGRVERIEALTIEKVKTAFEELRRDAEKYKRP
jgi:hypothetical protein